ncbi:MAG TPA: hypothetical protein VK395_13990 [Gemmataceae bacterium]|nr:hypothetical protein [Gemmataceae bacterium]
MQRLPDEATLQERLGHSEVGVELVESLARRIASFRRGAEANERIAVFGRLEAVAGIVLRLKEHVDLCPLHRRLDQALAMVENALQESTIAELIAESNPGKGIPKPLCPWPTKPISSALTVLKSK